MKRLPIALLALAATTLRADALSFATYESIRGTETGDYFIIGVGEGIGWSNTMLEQNGQPTLFCQPRDLAISAEAYDAMVAAATEADPSLEEYPVELVLIRELIAAYPCKRK